MAGKGHMRLEDFNIEGEIAKGSFGVVYRVVRKADGRVFALKQVKLEGLTRVEREETIDEARVLAQLNHPHVTKHYDSWIDKDSKLNIVMELASKGNLSQVVKANRGKGLPEEKVWRYMIQATLGLNHIHSKKIIHRDIKSLNLFLDSNDNVKIGDLGIARALSDDSNFARTIVGTPYYLSPELCEEKPYNEKSDIWALGVVLYEMTMGHYPFDAQNEGALIRKILRGQFPPVKGPYTPALVNMVSQCLTFKPDSRPDTYAMLRNPVVIAKAKALGVDMNPRLSGSSEDKPIYAALAAQQLQQYGDPHQQAQQQYGGDPYQRGSAGAEAASQQLQRPSGQTYVNYPPYNNNSGGPESQYAPDQQQQHAGSGRGQQQNIPPSYNAPSSPYGGPLSHQQQYAPPQQRQTHQRPASANMQTAGQRAGAGGHPFELAGGRGGPGRVQQQQTHQAWGEAGHGGPVQPYAVHPGADNQYDRMADEIERLQLGTDAFRRAQQEREAAKAANAAVMQRDQLKNIMQGGGPASPSHSRNGNYRMKPEEMPAAGGRNQQRGSSAPFALHNSTPGAMTMAQQQNMEAWTVNYSPPQYGRKRNTDLMATGPSMRGDSSGYRPSSAAYAPRAADDATSYMSSHTSYYR